MYRRTPGSGSSGGLTILILLLCLVLFFSLSQAASSSLDSSVAAPQQTQLSASSSVNDTQEHDELVLRAFDALRRRNKARVLRPAVNKYEFANTAMAANATFAPALEVEAAAPSNSTGHTRLMSDASDDAHASSPYTITSKLAKAAARMAEAKPQVPKGNHEELAHKTIEKHRHRKVNDTNAPPLQQRPYGRLGSYGVGEGFTRLHSDPMSVQAQSRSLTSETWWMAQQEQLGSAPFAPLPGYKVREILLLPDRQ